MPQFKLAIKPDGSAVAIYSDALLPVFAALGPATVRRASHVEPTPDGGWQADMSPLSGPRLPATVTRQASLDAELAWLDEHLIDNSSEDRT